MTTAARPTFDPAKGGAGRGEKSLSALSKQYSSRDLPSHLKLKYRFVSDNVSLIGHWFASIGPINRQSGQGTTDELKAKDFKRELEERERNALIEKEKKRSLSSTASTSSESRTSAAIASANKKQKIEAIAGVPANLDADEVLDEPSDDSEEDDSDEDDTQELLAELNRIKRERAEEEARKEAEKKANEERIRMENILSGNPLLNSTKSDFKVKRRWDEDVVFKNCARNDPDSKQKGFINDTLRSEFHKKFMEKYIK